MTKIHLAEKDEIFEKQRDYALSLCDPRAEICKCAQNFSKQKNYADAINSYLKLHPNVPIQWHESFGWDIYRYCAELSTANSDAIGLIKKYLFVYSQLKNQRPSLLHSMILNLAKKLAKIDKLKMGNFLLYWGLESFRPEDYERNTSQEGRSYPSLVEATLQIALKTAIHDKDIGILTKLIPFLKDIINNFSDNEWLCYYFGKSLVIIGCKEEALPYCKTICMAKINDFWTWELLGDALDDDLNLALACYSKAPLISTDDIYSCNLRIKTALLLAKLGYYAEAKREFENYALLKSDKLPQSARLQIDSNWYKDTVANSSNEDFFKSHAAVADEILLADLPWLNAVVGNEYAVEREKGEQLRRCIYFLSPDKNIPLAVETFCRAKSFPFNDFEPGSPIKIKGNYAENGSFRILSFSLRENGQFWDIFNPSLGLVNYINSEKNIYHIIIDQDRPLELFCKFNLADKKLNTYDYVKVLLAHSKKSEIKIVSISTTDLIPSDRILKNFSSEKIVYLNNYAFTESRLFISPNLVSSYKLSDYRYLIDYYEKDVFISGNAILNFNKKKNEWSWKVIYISNIFSPEFKK